MRADPLLVIPDALQGRPETPAVLEILAAALRAADPAAAVARHLRLDGNRLVCAGEVYDLEVYDLEVYDLKEIERVFVIGFGKAGAGMAAAVDALLRERIAGGLVIVKEGHLAGKPEGSRIGFVEAGHPVPDLTAGSAIELVEAGHPLPDFTAGSAIELVEAGHPLPDVRGLRAAGKLIGIAEEAGERDLLICLISGGGSALLTAPADGLELADLQTVSELLLASGASIGEFNAVRRQLSAVKGGRLARMAHPARVLSLVLSDVIGDDLAAIASGPTAPDPGSFEEASAVLANYGLLERVPVSVRRHLEAGARGERPGPAGPGDAVFERVRNVVIGSNRLAAEAAVSAARERNFRTRLLTTEMGGEAHKAGERLAGLLRRASDRRPLCLVAGGETVVTLNRGGKIGLGGRNQEMALASVEPLAGLPGALLLTLATDGGDGPTDAAGAAVTGDSLGRAAALGLDPHRFLERHDSYSFFDELGDLIRTGPTGTNVNDLVFLFTFPD